MHPWPTQGSLFLKYILSICIVVLFKILLMIHQLLIDPDHHHLALCWFFLFFFFNVNNKTIWYPFRERTDGALVRRVSHCISLDFAALGCVLPDYCCPAVSHSRKHLWHGTWLQGFWEKPVFLSVFAVWRDSISHKSPSFLPSRGWMDSELLQNCQEYKAYKINHKAKWICIGFNG